jgi:hypothetical protein
MQMKTSPRTEERFWNLKREFAGFPPRRRRLCPSGGPYVLEGLNLADCLRDFPTHRRREHLHALDYPVGVDNEAPAQFNTQLFVVNAVNLSNFSSRVRSHMEGNAS